MTQKPAKEPLFIALPTRIYEAYCKREITPKALMEFMEKSTPVTIDFFVNNHNNPAQG